MEFFRITKDIPFMRYALPCNILSSTAFILAVVCLVIRGLNFSIEFTGGTIIEVGYPQPPELQSLRDHLNEKGFLGSQVQNFGAAREVLIRVPPLDNQKSSEVGPRMLDILNSMPQSASNPPTLKRVEYVGPQIGEELANDGALALLVVIIGILIYLGLRFEWRFSIAALVANMHDVIIILGFFAWFQWEFSLPVLAAVLAVLGYSVNESVVVFDRVREIFKRTRGMDTPRVLNHAITCTMSRTVITHGSTMMMVGSMLLLGGEVLYYFALALTIGILFGIYSSIMVASPLVMWLGVSREQFVPRKTDKPDGMTKDGAAV